LQIEAGLDFGRTGLADEFQIIVVNGRGGRAYQWLLRKVEEDALNSFPVAQTMSTAIGLILCFDLVRRRKPKRRGNSYQGLARS